MSCIACLRGCQRQLTLTFVSSSSSSHYYRQFYTTSEVLRNYYDCLGLTPKASQRDIKQAYYKLSLKYHPDKSEKGNSEQFREITVAYETLGNIKLRRLYDRGALNVGHTPPTTSETVRENVNIRTANFEPGGRTAGAGRMPEFNFDDWSKAHSERVFQREEAVRRKILQLKHRQHDMDHNSTLLKLFTIFGFFTMLAIGISVMVGSTQYDKPKKKDSNAKDR